MEREFAKFLSTLGLKDYGRALWDLAVDVPADRPPPHVAPAVFAQILRQARHDPAVVAFGADALPRLHRYARGLEATQGFSTAKLVERVGRAPVTAVVVVPTLEPAFVALVDAIVASLRGDGTPGVLVIVTDEREESRPALPLAASANLLFWQDSYTGAAPARHLALLIHACGSPIVVALRSRLALDAIGSYGRALKTSHGLFVMLDAPVDRFTDIHHLRRVAPHATILAASEQDREILEAHAAGIDGPGLRVLTPTDTFAASAGHVADRRTEASRIAATHLLYDAPAAPRDPVAAHAASFDVTVTIVFHRERELVIPALASLKDMVEIARASGISVEARAVLDNPDATTRTLVAEEGEFLDDLQELALGDAAATRNAGVGLARGRFLAFLDGDDLWGGDWLLAAFRSATSAPSAAGDIWHPQALLVFWSSDCDRAAQESRPIESRLAIQQSSRAADFERRDVLFENIWSVNAFAAREIYERFPYRRDDETRQIGIEDWRWNLETLGHGIAHSVVPDTVHLIRIKDEESRGQRHDRLALLPFLC